MPRPKTGETKGRHVRIPDWLWNAAREKAAAENTTITEVIVRALMRYVGTPPRRRPPEETDG
jgi:hypothetical protein